MWSDFDLDEPRAVNRVRLEGYMNGVDVYLYRIDGQEVRLCTNLVGCFDWDSGNMIPLLIEKVRVVQRTGSEMESVVLSCAGSPPPVDLADDWGPDEDSPSVIVFDMDGNMKLRRALEEV